MPGMGGDQGPAHGLGELQRSPGLSAASPCCQILLVQTPLVPQRPMRASMSTNPWSRADSDPHTPARDSCQREAVLVLPPTHMVLGNPQLVKNGPGRLPGTGPLTPTPQLSPLPPCSVLLLALPPCHTTSTAAALWPKGTRKVLSKSHKTPPSRRAKHHLCRLEAACPVHFRRDTHWGWGLFGVPHSQGLRSRCCYQ